MKKQTSVIDENTRFNLRFDNIWSIVIAAVMLVVSFGVLNTRLTVVETKLDTLISNQQELTKEFRDWKRQYEERLGKTELSIAELKTVIGIKAR